MNKKENYFRQINSIAFPILMNYIISTIFEVLDKAIVGRYSTVDFASVGIASKIIYAVTGTLGILSVCYNILAAKIKAKNDENEFRRLFDISITISIIIGVIFIIISLLFGRFFFNNIYGLSGNLLKCTEDYFYIASITVLQNLVIFIFSVYFRNQLYTKITFYGTFISTVINIFFDISLVYGKFGLPELGGKGAAIGSVIGLFVNIIIYTSVLYKKYNHKIKINLNFVFIKKLFILYIPLLFQDFIESTLFSFILVGIISNFSLNLIASYNLLETVASIVLLPAFAFAQACMTLSLHHPDNISSKKIIKYTLAQAICCVSVIGMIIFIKPHFFFGMVTKDIDVINKSIQVFIVVFATQITNAIIQVLKSYLQGNNNEKFVLVVTVIISTISLIIISILIKYYDLFGMYIGILISNVLCLLIYFIAIRLYFSKISISFFVKCILRKISNFIKVDK